jgi:hypothetical protein
MASRKRPTAPQEQGGAAPRGSPAARRKRRADVVEQPLSPRMASVTALSVGREATGATQAKRATPPSDHGRVSTQPRAETRLSVRQCFAELRTALDEGWEIVQPIFARPLWSVADNSTTAFSFVLRREQATRLVTVPEGRTVQRFIRDRELTVDYRR